MLDQVSQADFEQNLHTVFDCVQASGESLPLQLTELRSGRSSPRQEQFALLFRGPLETPLAQGMYPLRHEVLGELDIFLVPVGMDAQGYSYEAVFNRLLPLAG